ncbi:hypothetical protein EON64_19245, partial [archaeon]
MSLRTWLAALCFILSLCIVGAFSEDVNLHVRFDEKTPYLFQILVNGQLWFQSSNVMYRADGRAYSTADGSTKLLETKHYQDSDLLGDYRATDLVFGHATSPAPNFIGRVKQYESFLQFEQIFPASLWDTASGDADDIVTAFPTLAYAPSALPEVLVVQEEWGQTQRARDDLQVGVVHGTVGHVAHV